MGTPRETEALGDAAIAAEVESYRAANSLSLALLMLRCCRHSELCFLPCGNSQNSIITELNFLTGKG